MASAPNSHFAAFTSTFRCPGRKAPQVREDVKSLVQSAKTACEAYFPRSRGYQIEAQSPAGMGNGVRVTVTRGDFRACVAIESSRPHRRNSGHESAIRMFGRVQSAVLHEAEAANVRWLLRSPLAGCFVGLALFAGVAWPLTGVSGPVFVALALQMTVVTALLTQVAGWGLMSYVGDRVARAARTRALAAVRRNPFFGDDLRRWKSLTRQLSAHGQAIACSGAGPFRALPAARGESLRTGDSDRITLSSFSFSS